VKDTNEENEYPQISLQVLMAMIDKGRKVGAKSPEQISTNKRKKTGTISFKVQENHALSILNANSEVIMFGFDCKDYNDTVKELNKEREATQKT
jgi:hypothetical protein